MKRQITMVCALYARLFHRRRSLTNYCFIYIQNITLTLILFAQQFKLIILLRKQCQWKLIISIRLRGQSKYNFENTRDSTPVGYCFLFPLETAF